MKDSSRNCCIVIIAAIVVAIVSFALLALNVLIIFNSLIFYVAAIITGAVFLLALLIIMAFTGKSKSICSSYCGCGNMAAIGAAGTIVTALIFSLASQILIVTNIGAAIVVFFATLMLGGIICFIYGISGCKRSCNRGCIPPGYIPCMPHQNECACRIDRDDNNCD